MYSLFGEETKRGKDIKMKIEEQVVSLELAKQLKELEIKQDSLWYYAKFEDGSYLDVRGAIQPDPIFS